MKARILLLLALPMAFAAGPALAHPGHDHGTLLSGLEHPLSGLDHMLAMTAAGLWASLRGGKALALWPAAFIGAMLGGFGLAQAGVSLPPVDPMVLASVVALGLLAATATRAPVGVGGLLIGLCGLVHGFAHGAEASASGALPFAIGFILASIGLLLAGLGAGLGLQALRRPGLGRLLGAVAALGGLCLAVAA